jgi:class 3 adenylate cyclase/TolB-like protein/Tfp pilus assembly protein PilF
MLERVQRRLAAILAADVVGYSRLIGQDEAGTLRRLKDLRRSLIDPAIKDHRGRIVKTTGDGILIEFPSAVEAVRLAVTVQRAMVDAEYKTPADRRIAFRIGVHQGDVVVDNNDLFGDGVNVAARLETLSEPGGVCVSSRVYEDMVGRLDLPFEDWGEQQVKNIARPVRVYSLGTEAIVGLPALPALTVDRPKSGFARWVVTQSLQTKSPLWLVLLAIVLALAGFGIWQVTKRSEAPAKLETANQLRGPTVAVLPFDNLSGDPSQDFFSQGLSEELITALSRFDHLSVLARNTTFAYKDQAQNVEELGRKLHAQYVIEGSFRSVPDQISVTAQLIDARTGTHVWAQTYARPTTGTNVLTIQDDIAQRIGAAVGDIRTGAVAGAEVERTRTKPAAELSSYECVLNAHLGATFTAAESVRRARTCLEATVKRDPTYGLAWAILARVLTTQRYYGVGLDSPGADDIDKRAYLVPRIIEAGNKAVELAPGNAEAHLALFQAYYAACEPERMRVELERVLAVNPNDANALATMGNDLAFTGSWDYGRQLAEKAIALAGPAAPRWWWWAIAKDYFRKGEYDKALEYFRRSYVEQSWLDHLHVVYTLPYLGRTEEARAQIPALLKLMPNMSVREADRYYAMWCFSADFRSRMTTALRQAGLREQ